MDASQRKLVLELSRKRISDDAFIAQFGEDPRNNRDIVRAELERALVERSAEDVESALTLASHFGLSASWALLLGRLLQQDWHTRHEDIAHDLQNIRDPSTVDALFETALTQHPYLAYDDNFGLARKCIWALHDIGTDAAKIKLQILSDSDIEPIRRYARKRLDDLAARRPGDPERSYRLARDATVRRD